VSQDKYSIHIEGDVSGQVGAGPNVQQTQWRSSAEEAVDPVRILFLAANPKDTDQLRLGEEVRTIDERLRTTDFRDRLDLVQHWAVRVEDLSDALLRHRPHVLHFSGHGSQEGAIILEDARGQSNEVSTQALADLFGILDDNLRCVVLNACYTATQAETVAAHIDCVIGTTRAISDPAALSFAGGFYRALGYGECIATAFALGRNEIDLAGLGEADTPKLLPRQGIDPASIHLVQLEEGP
jgi:CHAT domain-containing protein